MNHLALSACLIICGTTIALSAETTPESTKRGAAMYNRPDLCITCHQNDGAGVEDAYPSLVASPWVIGNPETLIRIVNDGVTGEITIGEHTFNTEMPGVGYLLKDDEAADLLTYVRSSWGNQASPITVDDILKVRKKDAARESKPWTVEELTAAAKPAP